LGLYPERAGVETQTWRFGFMRGQIKVPDNFDELGREEIEAMFNGDP
jgi:hypothetical protein